ncbi:MAG TPA: glycosyltransferase [Planctomycetota bacterium]
MKILAFSPTPLDAPGGNSATLRRIGRALAARGHVFDVLVAGPDARLEELRAAADVANPDVLHFYHAWKTGRFLPGLASRPTVLTLAGTDVNEDRADPARRAAVDAALAAADVVVTYSPALAPRARLLPKGVHLGAEPFDLRRAAGVGPGEILILQAGGIRPVKNNLFALKALHGDGLRLVFLGPVIDAAYGRELLAGVAAEPRARWLPAIPPDAMASAYAGADLVLNTSRSEGFSNALLEAMACGKAIVASDVVGNRELRPGLLYRDETELRDRVGRLAASPELRRELGESARARAAAFSVEKEVDALLDAYADARFRGGIGRIRC